MGLLEGGDRVTVPHTSCAQIGNTVRPAFPHCSCPKLSMWMQSLRIQPLGVPPTPPHTPTSSC